MATKEALAGAGERGILGVSRRAQGAGKTDPPGGHIIVDRKRIVNRKAREEEKLGEKNAREGACLFSETEESSGNKLIVN